jgi:hypothetical protein
MDTNTTDTAITLTQPGSKEAIDARILYMDSQYAQYTDKSNVAALRRARKEATLLIKDLRLFRKNTLELTKTKKA